MASLESTAASVLECWSGRRFITVRFQENDVESSNLQELPCTWLLRGKGQLSQASITGIMYCCIMMEASCFAEPIRSRMIGGY